MLASSKLLGMRDVCDILRVSKQFIHRLCAQNKIRYENTSSGKIFLEEDIVTYQKQRIEKAKTDSRVKIK